MRHELVSGIEPGIARVHLFASRIRRTDPSFLCTYGVHRLKLAHALRSTLLFSAENTGPRKTSVPRQQNRNPSRFAAHSNTGMCENMAESIGVASLSTDATLLQRAVVSFVAPQQTNTRSKKIRVTFDD